MGSIGSYSSYDQCAPWPTAVQVGAPRAVASGALTVLEQQAREASSRVALSAVHERMWTGREVDQSWPLMIDR